MFDDWFAFMGEFGQAYELRRIIFGLSAIIETPEEYLPPMINQKFDDIFDALMMLSRKMYERRRKKLQ